MFIASMMLFSYLMLWHPLLLLLSISFCLYYYLPILFQQFLLCLLASHIASLNPSSTQLSTIFITTLQCQRNQISNWQHMLDHRKSKGIPKRKKKNLLLLHWLHKSPWLCGSHLWKILKDTGVPDHLTCLLSNCMQDKRQQLEPDMEQRSDSKLERSNIKAVYFVALLI